MDPKAIVAEIVGGEGPVDDVGVEEEVDEGAMVAAEEMMDAFKSGDVQALAAALRSFMTMYQ